MATLPDLDTTSIGCIAYWNAIDQGGASSVAPDEVLSDGSITGYAIYDNGVEGDYTLGSGRTATFRVKNDGWFVVYLDRTELYAVNEPNVANVRGPWDIADDWTSGTSEVTQNTLERAVNSLQSELPNSGNITYNTSDVGLYDYNHTNATTITVLSASDNGDSGTKDYGFSYTSSTTRVTHAVVGKGQNNQFANTMVKSPSLSDVANADLAGEDVYGAYDLIANGEASSAETEYNVRHEWNDQSSYNNSEPVWHTNFIMWY